MRKMLSGLFMPVLACLPLVLPAQVALTGTTYSEHFNGIASGLPAGFTVRTGASSTAAGNTVVLNTATVSWATTSGQFANYASGNTGAGATPAQQASATDRAMGVRQTGSFGDPGAAFVFQVTNTTNRKNFVLDVKLQSLDAGSPRITTWHVDYGFGSAPTSFAQPAVVTGTLTTGGQLFSNQTIRADFGSALDNHPGIVTIRIVASTPSTGSGTRPTTAIDDFVLHWEDPDAKTIDLSTTAIFFPVTPNGRSTTRSYTITGQTNLDSPIVITAAAPFSVSSDSTNFSNALSVDPAEAAGKVIYVRFTPDSAGVYSGSVEHLSEGAATKTVSVSGEGVDPLNRHFTFNTCTPAGIPGSGFMAVNTVGSQKWACSGFGRNNTNGISVNGFAGGSAQTNEAWLISPPIYLGDIVHTPVLSFYSRGEFTGPALRLYVSTDYDGSSSPATATWTEIPDADFPTPPGTATTVWTFSDNIDLAAFKGHSVVYIAFKYTSSPAANAARWSLDDVMITDQSALLTITPAELQFGEVALGAHSPASAVTVRAIGNTYITVSPPAGYELSRDSISFSTSPVVIDPASAAAGTPLYVRFAPAVKALKIEGLLQFSAPGLNRHYVHVSGSAYPRSETFDAATYNISFFGSNSTNNPTPEKIGLQINNIATVLQRLNMDVVAIEELSSDSALQVLLTKLPGYASVISPRWSYSFIPPDPEFPPQKIGFIYDTATMKLSAAEPPRVLFEALYDSARLDLPGHRITHYPTGTPSSFWSSGRLPFMATFDAQIGGDVRKLRLIVIHAKSSSDAESYNRRVYDIGVLKDSIDAYYRNDHVLLLGDYNDRLVGSIYRGSPVSPYQPFLADSGYAGITRPLDSAGRVSFPGGSGLIDHIMITRPMHTAYIAQSTDIEDPRAYIAGYDDSTASDHLPVYARFYFAPDTPPPPPVALLEFAATQKWLVVELNWATGHEKNNNYFRIERSANGVDFTAIGQVAGKGHFDRPADYRFTDANPLAGRSYYRLVMVLNDGDTIQSPVVAFDFKGQPRPAITVVPNPVSDHIHVNINAVGQTYTVRVLSIFARELIRASGDLNAINLQLNSQLYKLKPGIYVLRADNAAARYITLFVKR